MHSVIARHAARSLRVQPLFSDWLGLLLILLPVLAALVIGWAATAAGPGVNADGVNYINMATNIQTGRGFGADFVDTYSELPYGPVTFWPPAYSMLIAGAMTLGLSGVEAARWVSILSLGGLIYTTYLVGQQLNRQLSGVLTSIAAVCLMPVVRLGTFALSEAPFALFSMLVLLAAIQYAQVNGKHTRRWLLICALCVAMAILTRYVGVIWLIGLGAIVVWKERRRATSWWRTLLTSFAACTIAVMPIMPWLARNWQLTGYLTGMDREHKFHPGFLENLRFLMGTMSSDLAPPIHFGLRELLANIPVFLLIFMALCVITLTLIGAGRIWRNGQMNRKLTWRGSAWLDWLCTPLALTLQFSALYLVGMLWLSTTMEFPPYDWPRTAAVIYPCLIALAVNFAATSIRLLLNIRFLSRFGALEIPILVLAAALCIMPYALQTRGFIQEAAKGQEFTTAAWRQNQALRAITMIADEQSIIYSDRAPAAYLYLQRPVRYLPQRGDVDAFYQFLERKLAHLDSPEYVLTFKGALGSNDPYRSSRMSYAEMLELMAAHTEIALVADLADGAIFRIGSDIE